MAKPLCYTLNPKPRRTFLAVQHRAVISRLAGDAWLLMQRLLPAQPLRGVPGVCVPPVAQIQRAWAHQLDQE